MKHINPTWKYFAPVIILILLAILSTGWILSSARSQSRSRTVSNSNVAVRSATENSPNEAVKVDVDLVTVDALVMQKKKARTVGGLKKDDFTLFEDGVKQEITHFGQDSLPLSVLLLIDRGGCLDPFGSEVHHAALDAISRLKPVDEIAVMTYHDTTRLLQGFTRDRALIEDALNQVPPRGDRNHGRHA